MDESVEAILAELRSELNDAAAAHGFATMGLRRASEFLQLQPRVPENPDPTIYFTDGHPEQASTRHYARWRISEALEQVALQGPVEISLDQQFIVFLFSIWEHEYRPRLAVAHGCPTDSVRYPLLGDLRRLRNDVVHHHGIATRGETGRCEPLEHWFEVGDRIRLSEGRLAELVELFPWEKMATRPS